MATIVYSVSFIEEVKKLLEERASVIAEFPHGTILAGVSGTLNGFAVYDPKAKDPHDRRVALTAFWDAVTKAKISIKLQYHMMEDLGCLVIKTPTEEQFSVLRTLEV